MALLMRRSSDIEAPTLSRIQALEIKVRQARSDGQPHLASVALEQWVAAGREMVVATERLGSWSVGASAQPAASTAPNPKRGMWSTPRSMLGTLGVAGLVLTPRLVGRRKSITTAIISSEEGVGEEQLESWQAASQKMLQKAGRGGESIVYLCRVDKHNERGKVRCDLAMCAAAIASGDQPGRVQLRRRRHQAQAAHRAAQARPDHG
eukprot:scaffold31897_cov58-Phaeocystis_antarctica.AAC.3